jgi:hypothetical protein
MTGGFAYAIVILAVPALVLAAGVAAWLHSHDDATRALSLPFAYACVVVCGVTAVRLGIRGQALALATVGPALIAGCALLALRRGLSAASRRGRCSGRRSRSPFLRRRTAIMRPAFSAGTSATTP